MILKDDKKGLVTLIMKRMKGSHRDMSPSYHEYEHAEEAPTKDGAEQDNSMALESASEDMMEAIKNSDASLFKSALMSFIEMSRDEY